VSSADIDEQNTNQLDPMRPRPIDLPTILPAGGQIEPAVGDIAKIFAAPEDPAEWPRWRADLAIWRDEARHRIGYDGAAYRDPRLAWTRDCRAVAVVWLWDERLYDADAELFTPDRLLGAYAGHGGLDGLVLWHAYPVIGIDDRNQFDFYRDVPRLAELVSEFRARGLRVFVDYNPWDVGTRRPAHDDATELASLVRELGADGVFLDTLKQADDHLISTLASVDPPPALEGESRVPLERIADHHLSWAQWFADSAVPGVLRARWFERRHMMHGTRRWNRDHSDELQTAWINGSGILVWDVVFGSWVGWNARDRGTLARMLTVQRAFPALFTDGDWEPLALLDPVATAAGVYASRFTDAELTAWTFVNRGTADYDGPMLPSVDVVVPARSIAVALAPAERASVAVRAGVEGVLRRLAALEVSSDIRFPAREPRRVPSPRSAGTAPDDAIRLTAGDYELDVVFRRRETGIDGEAPYVEEWKPLPPRLHDDRRTTWSVRIGEVAVATREVSMAELAAYRAATGAAPSGGDRPVDEDAPAAGVTLAEARAYAAWAGARLPDDAEWQLAAGRDGFDRRHPLVWNWTESEFRDGATRYVLLVGGSDHHSEGSDWYFDAGPREPGFRAKYLLPGLGLDASPSIGFRLAWDLA